MGDKIINRNQETTRCFKFTICVLKGRLKTAIFFNQLKTIIFDQNQTLFSYIICNFLVNYLFKYFVFKLKILNEY